LKLNINIFTKYEFIAIRAREGKGMGSDGEEGKGREGKGREGKGREGKQGKKR
jgi:hypothetical protein